MVVDASAVVELLLGGERGRAVARELAGSDADRLAAPDLLDVEVVSAFRRLTAGGHLSEARAAASLELLDRLPLTRHPVRALVPRIWAHRSNLTAYDGAYVALAEALARPLLTCDGRLADAPGHRALVRVV